MSDGFIPVTSFLTQAINNCGGVQQQVPLALKHCHGVIYVNELIMALFENETNHYCIILQKNFTNTLLLAY